MMFLGSSKSYPLTANATKSMPCLGGKIKEKRKEGGKEGKERNTI